MKKAFKNIFKSKKVRSDDEQKHNAITSPNSVSACSTSRDKQNETGYNRQQKGPEGNEMCLIYLHSSIVCLINKMKEVDALCCVK